MESKLLTSFSSLSRSSMSSNKRRTVQQIQTDRISELPDQALYQIFSNLDMQQVVQTSILSTKWKNLWKSTQHLNFHMNQWQSKKDNLQKFITNLLLERDHSIIIHKFGVVGDQMINIDGFITLAATRNVHELCLKNMLYLDMPTLGLVAEVRVKTLNLTSVHAFASTYNPVLDFNSPILETLVLNDFHHPGVRNLRITAPHLRVLDINNDRMGDNRWCVLTIDTPFLKSFRFKRHMYRAYIIENLYNLEKADIEIDLEGIEGRKLGTRLLHFLEGISNARFLKLSFKGYQSISVSKSVTEIANLLQWPSVTFNNLTHLELDECHNNNYMSAIGYVLESFPCVETLVFHKQKINSLPMIELMDWGTGLPFESDFSQLRCVELLYSELSTDLFQFIEFLLRFAKVLETVTVKLGNVMSSEVQPELYHFFRYLKSAPKASSKVRLLVVFPGGVTLTCSGED